MLIYEVNIAVDADVFDEYLLWMGSHIQEMLKIEGFEQAAMFQAEDDDKSGKRVKLSVHYGVKDDKSLQRYFKQDAARMRADGVGRFGNKFQASRRILKQKGVFRNELSKS